MNTNAFLTGYTSKTASSDKQDKKVSKVMGEYKRGTLNSGSKDGPKVKSRDQAIAIAMSEAGIDKKKDMNKEAAIPQSVLRALGRKSNINEAVTQAISGVKPLPASIPKHTISRTEIREMLNPTSLPAKRVDVMNPVFAAEIAKARANLQKQYVG